jgi:hypothetical protein
VGVGVWVAVGDGVVLGVTVLVGVAVMVAVGLGVSVEVDVAVLVAVPVAVGVAVLLAVAVGDGVSVEVAVAVGVSVGTSMAGTKAYGSGHTPLFAEGFDCPGRVTAPPAPEPTGKEASTGSARHRATIKANPRPHAHCRMVANPFPMD